jgi:hypothetical protein
MESLDRAIAMMKAVTGQEPREAESNTELEETEATGFEAIPEEMKSVAVQEDAAVGTGRALNKRHGDRNLAVGRRGKPKERTQGNGGSRKKLAAARRGMTLPA